MSAKFVFCQKRETSAAVILAALIVLVGGCRQAPSSDKQYYEKELQQMRISELRTANTEKTMKDGYPWRSGNSENSASSLPSRIKRMENSLDNETSCLQELVHGKKKTRLKLRD
ncbi:MAG: hypothetical protein EOM80_04580 [Erysipelotrichia bacterium]|nr:hypothetical protein [Erysipelotrichia bacterium]